MDKIFLTILNMSFTGAFVIIAILLMRFPLKKVPKIISYCLWTVAGFRLVFPFTINSIISLIPFNAAPIPKDIGMQAVPRIDSGITFVDNAISSVLPVGSQYTSVNPLQVWTVIGAFLWLLGIIVMIVYSVVSLFLLKHKLCNAKVLEKNIYQTDKIYSPFLLGVIRPRIYIPVGLTKNEQDYVILHERVHIKRHDHVIKYIAYFILCLHWFNPLVWIAFILMGEDMEMSCDESVLNEMGSEAKRGYSLSLLSLATDKRKINGSPLAFGESDVKERVKNILNFRKPSRMIIIASIALVVVLIIGFSLNRSISKGEIFIFHNSEFHGASFKTDREAYNPEFVGIPAELMNIKEDTWLGHSNKFTLVKQSRENWEIVPFKDGNGLFQAYTGQFVYGVIYTYLLKPEMLYSKLSEGRYRIVTDVWYNNTPEKYTVWAEFSIDKNAELQEPPYAREGFKMNRQGKHMTIDDIKYLAQNFGPYLIPGDLIRFLSEDIGSGLNVMTYDVEYGKYQLRVSTNNGINILNTSFSRVNDGQIDENAIDIRYYDVGEYVASGAKVLVHEIPKSDSLPDAKLTVSGTPDKYTPAMSSSPGILLNINLSEDYDILRLSAYNDYFLHWETSAVSSIGKDMLITKDSPAIYWQGSQDDTIYFNFFTKNGTLVYSGGCIIREVESMFFSVFD